ncbi:MAG: xanthine dehydrogenase family protein molybdopterin-binding subunit [Rhodospirillales bacterium]|jgi:carbon-monoxide dehydrogenase large subunit
MTTSENKIGVGASLPRKEDHRFLRGRGLYVADVHMPGILDVAFLRGQQAHGRLLGIQIPEGEEDRVFTAERLTRVDPVRVEPSIPGFKPADHHALATDKVRFAGECIAACLGTNRAEAEDLAEQIIVDIEELPAVTEPIAARDDPLALVHEEWGDNIYVQHDIEGGDIDSVRDAPVVVTRDYRMNRQSVSPLEPRAVLAHWDERSNELVVHISTQIPHLMRTALSQFLNLPTHQLRVIAPDVGGGFGGKARLMPEEIVVCAIALETGKPIRWLEDRHEHLMAAPQAREHVYRITAYADSDGLIKGIDAELTVDAGAYALWHSGPFMETGMAARNLSGPYQIENLRCKTWTVATNKAPMGVYRGVARPGACFAIERTIDEVARAVGRDPMEVRMANMVTAEQMPYETVGGMCFDNGDYPESVRRVASLVDYQGIRARQGAAQPDGRLLGVGLASYSEQTAHGSAEWTRRGSPIIPGFESATARLNPDGTLVLLVGIHSHGQGLETTLAQIAYEELGIHPNDINVRFGDTGVSPFGFGTFASRSMVMSGGAVSNVCINLREKLALIAAHQLQCDVEQVRFADGEARGASGSISIAEICRIAHLRQDGLPDGVDPILDATETYEPSESTGVFSYATHAAVVLVDPQSGAIELIDYAVVEDCGNMVNPMIVDGQITGGVAQGIGTAIYEESIYDENGQPLATTFADYLLPGATEIPDIKIGHMVTPAVYTRFGIKGMGEGGAIAPPAAIGNALRDAFAATGAQFNETPFTPRRVLDALDNS